MVPARSAGYLLAEHEETPTARAVAAVLSLGGDAVLEGGSAAFLWRMHDTAPAPVLEIDGWAFHRGLRAFLLDGPRQSALQAHWYELRDDPDALLRRLRAVLGSRRVRGGR